MTQETVYHDSNGTTYFVGQGIGGPDGPWMTFRQGDPNKGMHLVKSVNLPGQPTREAAQADLDAYAKKRGFRVLERPEIRVKAAEPERDYSARNNGGQSLVPLTDLRPSGLNSRRHFGEQALQELAESIRLRGILEPLVVRPRPRGETGFDIIAGERRYRAALMAEQTHAPVHILEDVDDKTAIEISLVENLCRKDIDPIEEAEGYRMLREMGHGVTSIAERVNRSQEAVSNAMRLLKLPEAAQEHIREGRLSASHGKALVSLADYPKLLDMRMDQALAGTPVKQIEKIEYDYNIIDAGLMVVVRSAAIGVEATKKCQKCRHRRKKLDDGWLCLDPACYQELNVAETFRLAEKARKKFDLPDGAKLPRLGDMSYSSYKCFDKRSAPPECKPDCEHRKVALGNSNEPVEICVDPKCWDKLASAAKRDANKQRKADIDEMWEKSLALLEDGGDDNMTVVLACLKTLCDAPASILKATLERAGISLNVDLNNFASQKSHKVYAALFGIEYSDLVALTAEVALAVDAKDARAQDYHVPALLEWFSGREPSTITAECPVCGKEFLPAHGWYGVGETAVCGWTCQQKLKENTEANAVETESPDPAKDPEGANDEDDRSEKCRLCGDLYELYEDWFWVEPGLCNHCAKDALDEEGIYAGSLAEHRASKEIRTVVVIAIEEHGVGQSYIRLAKTDDFNDVIELEIGEFINEWELHTPAPDESPDTRTLSDLAAREATNIAQANPKPPQQSPDEPEAVAYADAEDCKPLFVAQPVRDGSWGTFRHRASGALKRVVSPAMPMVPTRAKAQRNLDAWATKRGLFAMPLPDSTMADVIADPEGDAGGQADDPDVRRDQSITDQLAALLEAGEKPSIMKRPDCQQPGMEYTPIRVTRVTCRDGKAFRVFSAANYLVADVVDRTYQLASSQETHSARNENGEDQ